MAAEMTMEAAEKLRAPFPDSAVGKLPKGGAQLDYVGHAAVTDRLLAVDPEWTWEPMAYADDGGPMIRLGGKDAELWIRMTVCGLTRIGVGTAPSGAFDLPKQLVSDAIRNAAMRFGVALDLWSKEDLHDVANPPAPEPTIPKARAEQIAELINQHPEANALRAEWKKRFQGVKPIDLPLSLLGAANDFVSDLEPVPGGEA